MANSIPKGYVSLPRFPLVDVMLVNDTVVTQRGRAVREIWIRYYGTAEDLVQAGIATHEQLAPGRARKRVDVDGDRCRIDRYFRLKEGVPYRYYRFTRIKPIERIGLLPGARAAMAAAATREEYFESIRGTAADRWKKAPVRTPVVLRLVVDNTRRDLGASL